MSTASDVARRTALITGASSGIGLELARIFAQNGHDLVITARSRQKLREVGDLLQAQFGVQVRAVPKDLAHPKAIQEIVYELKEAELHIDYLVNNAGFGTYGPFWQTNEHDEMEMLQVNIVALTQLTKLLLPDIMSRRGKIMNVASTAAFQPGPYMAVYYASKAYVLSFSEALSEELRSSGVTVTALCPGPTKSAFQERAQLKNMLLVQESMMMQSREVAHAGYDGMMRGKRLVIPGWKNWAVAESVRFSPRGLVLKIAKFIQTKRA